MTEVAVHTVLRPGREAEYDRLHSAIPIELAARLRVAGVHDWRIWRAGLHLFHLIDVDDYPTMRKTLAADPVNERWQELVNILLEEPDDYSGTDEGIGRVWSLSAQLTPAESR
jgi:L-rhamnose mutarotase